VADGSLFGRVRGPIVFDLFAGGGGASHGIRSALGVSPVVAINHCRHAIEMHTLNHPETEHYLWCLGTTADGSPRHPLYVRGDAPLIPWGTGTRRFPHAAGA